jgi:hypothetical protein
MTIIQTRIINTFKFTFSHIQVLYKCQLYDIYDECNLGPPLPQICPWYLQCTVLISMSAGNTFLQKYL